MFIEVLDKSTSTSLSEPTTVGRFDPSADTAEINTWVKTREGPDSLNYAADHDSLLLVWDDTEAPERAPNLSLIIDFIDPDIVHVFVDGVPMAEIKGDPDLTAQDITLIPLSAAQIVGLTPC